MNRDDIIRMAQEAGWGFNNSRDSDFVKAQLKFAELVAAAEREECAKLCDILNESWMARRIRARGQS
jgi:hypothetical protein